VHRTVHVVRRRGHAHAWALAGGPGLLTEIDVKVTLNAKLGEDMEAACRAHGPGPRPAAGS
jgi:hypothetical protein